MRCNRALSKNSARAGLGLQASYTYSKSLDDTSAVLGGLLGTNGTVLQTFPQNPWDPAAEKGAVDIRCDPCFFGERDPGAAARPRRFSSRCAESADQRLAGFEHHHADHGIAVHGLLGDPADRRGRRRNRSSRPDRAASTFDKPHSARRLLWPRARTILRSSISRSMFQAAQGPNQGRFGTLGRNTFRGPGYKDFDFAMIKDTPFGHRGNAEMGTVEFRAEFFNVFNMVNFGLPSNILRGSGFGIISRTAGTSRQIQFSLKIIY